MSKFKVTPVNTKSTPASVRKTPEKSESSASSTLVDDPKISANSNPELTSKIKADLTSASLGLELKDKEDNYTSTILGSTPLSTKPPVSPASSLEHLQNANLSQTPHDKLTFAAGTTGDRKMSGLSGTIGTGIDQEFKDYKRPSKVKFNLPDTTDDTNDRSMRTSITTTADHTSEESESESDSNNDSITSDEDEDGSHQHDADHGRLIEDVNDRDSESHAKSNQSNKITTKQQKRNGTSDSHSSHDDDNDDSDDDTDEESRSGNNNNDVKDGNDNANDRSTDPDILPIIVTTPTDTQTPIEQENGIKIANSSSSMATFGTGSFKKTKSILKNQSDINTYQTKIKTHDTSNVMRQASSQEIQSITMGNTYSNKTQQQELIRNPSTATVDENTNTLENNDQINLSRDVLVLSNPVSLNNQKSNEFILTSTRSAHGSIGIANNIHVGGENIQAVSSSENNLITGVNGLMSGSAMSLENSGNVSSSEKRTTPTTCMTSSTVSNGADSLTSNDPTTSISFNTSMVTSDTVQTSKHISMSVSSENITPLPEKDDRDRDTTINESEKVPDVRLVGTSIKDIDKIPDALVTKQHEKQEKDKAEKEKKERELERRRNEQDSLSTANRQAKVGRVGNDRNEKIAESPAIKGVGVAGRFIKYREELGRGSFKTVYKGYDTESGCYVAWQELSSKTLTKQERQKFKDEADMLKTLTHKNLIRFLTFFEYDINNPFGVKEKSMLEGESASNRNKPTSHGGINPKYSNQKQNRCMVLITELMTSGTLKDFLKKNYSRKPPGVKIVKDWSRQILQGLHFLHNREIPISHRDLKCDNVFIVGATGEVKVGDVGLAKASKAKDKLKSLIGTPEFMAPEVFNEDYNHKCDIWSFGLCLLEIATTEYPYNECKNPMAIYGKVKDGVKPESLNTVEDTAMREIINKCLEKDPLKRPDTLQLLNEEFFQEETYITIQSIERASKDLDTDGIYEIQMKFDKTHKSDTTKRIKEAIKENGLKIAFNLRTDTIRDKVELIMKNDKEREKLKNQNTNNNNSEKTGATAKDNEKIFSVFHPKDRKNISKCLEKAVGDARKKEAEFQSNNKEGNYPNSSTSGSSSKNIEQARTEGLGTGQKSDNTKSTKGSEINQERSSAANEQQNQSLSENKPQPAVNNNPAWQPLKTASGLVRPGSIGPNSTISQQISSSQNSTVAPLSSSSNVNIQSSQGNQGTQGSDPNSVGNSISATTLTTPGGSITAAGNTALPGTPALLSASNSQPVLHNPSKMNSIVEENASSVSVLPVVNENIQHAQPSQTNSIKIDAGPMVATTTQTPHITAQTGSTSESLIVDPNGPMINSEMVMTTPTLNIPANGNSTFQYNGTSSKVIDDQSKQIPIQTGQLNTGSNVITNQQTQNVQTTNVLQVNNPHLSAISEEHDNMTSSALYHQREVKSSENNLQKMPQSGQIDLQAKLENSVQAAIANSSSKFQKIPVNQTMNGQQQNQQQLPTSNQNMPPPNIIPQQAAPVRQNHENLNLNTQINTVQNAINTAQVVKSNKILSDTPVELTSNSGNIERNIENVNPQNVNTQQAVIQGNQNQSHYSPAKTEVINNGNWPNENKIIKNIDEREQVQQQAHSQVEESNQSQLSQVVHQNAISGSMNPTHLPTIESSGNSSNNNTMTGNSSIGSQVTTVLARGSSKNAANMYMSGGAGHVSRQNSATGSNPSGSSSSKAPESVNMVKEPATAATPAAAQTTQSRESRDPKKEDQDHNSKKTKFSFKLKALEDKKTKATVEFEAINKTAVSFEYSLNNYQANNPASTEEPASEVLRRGYIGKEDYDLWQAEFNDFFQALIKLRPADMSQGSKRGKAVKNSSTTGEQGSAVNQGNKQSINVSSKAAGSVAVAQSVSSKPHMNKEDQKVSAEITDEHANTQKDLLIVGEKKLAERKVEQSTQQPQPNTNPQQQPQPQTQTNQLPPLRNIEVPVQPKPVPFNSTNPAANLANIQPIPNEEIRQQQFRPSSVPGVYGYNSNVNQFTGAFGGNVSAHSSVTGSQRDGYDSLPRRFQEAGALSDYQRRTHQLRLWGMKNFEKRLVHDRVNFDLL